MSSFAWKKVAATAAATLGIFVFLPTGTAAAVEHANCGEQGVVQITMHTSGRGSEDICYKNTGTWDINSCALSKTWFDKVYTGNYVVTYHDCDGTDVTIGRNTIMTFPNRVPAVKRFTLS